MIRHTVVFKLKHATDSAEEQTFLSRAQKLSSIKVAKNFECLRQTSKKNNFDFGLSMEFDSQADYDSYNNHPEHVHFVATYWMTEVVDFMEIDYERY